MTFFGLALCAALISFGLVNALTSLVAVVLSWRVGSHRSPVRRARRLMLLRLLPAAVSSAFVAALFVPAFLLLEPRDTIERLSPAMLGFAASAAILAFGPLRAVGSILATRRLARRWQQGARPATLAGLPLPVWIIDEALPVVTVLGLLRPRLYVARKVLEDCTVEELAAIVQHEIGHLRSRDNWKRLLRAALPDWIAITPWGERLERAWSEAAEDAADDHAARTGSPVDLASALLKVARMTPSPVARYLPASALYRGVGLERRIGRLLGGPADGAEGRGEAFSLAIALAAIAAAFSLGLRAGLLQRVQALTEAIVGLLQ